MQIDVFFGTQEMSQSDVSGRVVAVIDVLRATTSMAVALANGAKAVIPFENAEEAITRSKAFSREDRRRAGERKMLPIAGFDFGNSPREFTAEAVGGKTVLMTTTNGTGTFQVVQGARDVVIASYVNFTPVLTMLRAALRGKADVTIICAGRDKRFSLEDAACAGRYVHHLTRRLTTVQLNDAAIAATLIDRKYGDNLQRLFGTSTHGRALAEAGFAEDLEICGTVDGYPIIPVYQDRQITKLGPERER